MDIIFLSKNNMNNDRYNAHLKSAIWKQYAEDENICRKCTWKLYCSGCWSVEHNSGAMMTKVQFVSVDVAKGDRINFQSRIVPPNHAYRNDTYNSLIFLYQTVCSIMLAWAIQSWKSMRHHRKKKDNVKKKR